MSFFPYMKSPTVTFDQYGHQATPAEKLKTNSPRKFSMGLADSIYSPNNVGGYRQRYYSLQDNEQGLDSLSRELQVRWSREMCWQLPFMATAIQINADYVVGRDYNPKYIGSNTEFGEAFYKWWNYYQYLCCARGYDWNTCVHIACKMLDQDGDMLFIYGQPGGLPQFQVLPTNRVRSPNYDNQSFGKDGEYENGRLQGKFVTDGVVFDPKSGESCGWNVVSVNNVVNSTYNTTNTFYSSTTANLFFDPKVFDKGRGIPSYSPGIVQAISLQETLGYLMEKAKVESMVLYEEQTPSGLGPQTLQDIKNAIEGSTTNQVDTALGPFGRFTPGVSIVNGPHIKFVRAVGGGIKYMPGQTTGETTLEFMKRLEQQVMSLIGVPHQLVFSTEEASGKISDGLVQNWRKSILRRQGLLDRQFKRVLCWAVAVAQKNGILPKNDEEDITQIFSFSHPSLPDMNESYTERAKMEKFQNGVYTLADVVPDVDKHIATQTQIGIKVLKAAQQIVSETGVDLNTAISFVTKNLTSVNQGKPQEDQKEEETAK